MRNRILLCCAVLTFATVAAWGAAAPAPPLAAAGGPESPCNLVDSPAPYVTMNLPLGAPQPVPAQTQVPQCNCTLPGTAIPPGQLGVRCATPIGQPTLTCQNLTCFTSITTPWINGVCR